MKKTIEFIDIQQAAALTGLSVTTLRNGVKSGRFPAIRTSGKGSKILFDKQLLIETLRNEAIGNVAGKQTRSYLANLFKAEDDTDTTPSATIKPR